MISVVIALSQGQPATTVHAFPTRHQLLYIVFYLSCWLYGYGGPANKKVN